MKRRAHETLLARLTCLACLATLSGCSDSGRSSLTDPPATGTITGTVTFAGSQFGGATVNLVGRGETMITGPDGTFAFTDLPPGAYTVAVTSAAVAFAFDCQAAIVHVQAGQTAPANITCTGPTGSIIGKVSDADLDNEVPFATVIVSGPLHGTATTGTSDPSPGGFAFETLPPGDYTVIVTASLPVFLGVIVADCQSASASVQAGQTTTIDIECEIHPNLDQIPGHWSYLAGGPGSQVGGCPPPLSRIGWTGSMAVDPGSGTIAVRGLDPELEIVGTYDRATGAYTGEGIAMLEDSSIQTDMAAIFGYEPTLDDTSLIFDGALTRQHRDAAGNAVCAETYEIIGRH